MFQLLKFSLFLTDKALCAYDSLRLRALAVACALTLTACAGLAHLQKQPACVKRYPMPPYTLAIDLPLFEQSPEILAGAIAWEKKLGVTVFQVVDGEPADIFITTGPAPEGKDWIASTETYCAAGGLAQWRITVHVPQFGWALTNVIIHEFGHVLGLGHAPQEADIMNATVQTETLEEISVDDEIVPPQRIMPWSVKTVQSVRPELAPAK